MKFGRVRAPPVTLSRGKKAYLLLQAMRPRGLDDRLYICLQDIGRVAHDCATATTMSAEGSRRQVGYFR